MSWDKVAFSLISKWEGLRLKAYPDPATDGVPWTIGYGKTGPTIGSNTTWTKAQSDQALFDDIQNIGNDIDNFDVSLTNNQKSALTSLIYNVGISKISSSTLVKCLKNGDIKGASSQFLVWNRAAGKINPGLVNRRKDEKKVFDTPDAP